MSLLRKKVWSPYLAGAIIALLQIPAFLLVGTALGSSSSFVKVAGHLGQIFDPNITQIGYFEKYMTSDKYYWQLALVIGMALGAYFSAKLSGTGRKGIASVWKKAMPHYSDKGRRVMAFVGGFILLYGARLAGGCTSGHGISGMSQLGIGSFITVVSMFAGGIIAARFLRRV